MIIKNNGNVGVGTNDPDGTLEISSTRTGLTALTNNEATLMISCTDTNAADDGDIGGGVVFRQRWVNSDSSLVPTGGIYGYKDRNSGSYGGGLIFTYCPDNGSPNNLVEAMRITKEGFVTMKSKPAFYAWDNITSRSGTTLTFNSTTYNIGSHFNTSTSRFRTPVAGTYIFAAVIAHDYANTFGSAYFSFYVDGTNHRDILEGMPSHDAHYESHGVYIVNLAVNQYVDIRARSGHNINFVNGNHGAYYRNCFQGALLG